MAFKFNPLTGQFDMVLSMEEIAQYFLRLDTSNDPLTGELVINPSSGDNAIVIKAGKRLVFDGA